MKTWIIEFDYRDGGWKPIFGCHPTEEDAKWEMQNIAGNSDKYRIRKYVREGK